MARARLIRGIAWRLALLVVFGGGVVMAMVLVAAEVTSQRLLEVQVRGRATALATATAGTIETVLGGVEASAEGLRIALEEIPGADDHAGKLVRALVEQHHDVFGAAAAVGVDPATGRARRIPYVHRSDDGVVATDLAAGGYEYLGKEWYARPLELRRPVWTEPYLDVGGGDVVMTTYAVPVVPAGGPPTGVVTCDLALDWLSGLLGTLPLEEDGYGFVVSSEGTFVAHPDHRLVLRSSLASVAEGAGRAGLADVAERMLRGDTGFVRFDSLWTGEPSWLAFAPVSSTGWSLGVVLPTQVVDARQAELHRALATVGGIGFAGLVAVAVLLARTITRPVRQLEAAARRVATGDLDAPLPRPGRDDEVARLASAFASMQADLKQHIVELERSTAARERIQRELQIARDIQRSLLPKRFPPFPERRDLDLHALLEPAREVGGDLYDYFFLDGDELCILVGDVSGKGVPAALFMAVTRTLLSTLLHAGRPPGEVLSRVNDELARDNDACMFVTVFCAVVDLASGRCRYANAGHNPPLLARVAGDVTEVPPTGDTVVGAMPGLEFAERELELSMGDTLVLFTDGVVEAADADGAFFGNERTAAVVAESAERPCRRVVEELRAAVQRFAGDAEQSDDLTIVALRRLRREQGGKA